MASTDPTRPNIVLVLTDDQGAWAMGCAGNSEIRTPNLDRLAATGIRAHNFFCASPVCSPARASLMTGRIPSQHGVHDWIRAGNVNSTNDNWLIGYGEADHAIEYLQGMTGYTDVLAANGYTCAFSGKWHLGDSVHPQKGFSKWYCHARGGGHYYHAPMFQDGQLVEEEEYVTYAITNQALVFLDELIAGEDPFYLSVHYTAPHSPWGPDDHPDDMLALYADCAWKSCPDEPLHPWQNASAPVGLGDRRRENLTGYYASITAMDRDVGRLIDRLEEAGLRENTLFIFTADNGMNMGHHGVWGKGNGTFPQNMYDTSVKVPFLVSRPGHVPEGVVDEHLLSHYDVMPTLLEYVGVDNPEAARLPGHSFAPLLAGTDLADREQVVIFDEYGPVRMIRTREWKYVHRYPYGPHELYDLVNDPDERHNLVDAPDQQARIVDLRGRLTDWFVRYVDPALDGTHEAVYGSGQLDRVGPAAAGRESFARPLHQVKARE